CDRTLPHRPARPALAAALVVVLLAEGPALAQQARHEAPSGAPAAAKSGGDARSGASGGAPAGAAGTANAPTKPSRDAREPNAGNPPDAANGAARRGMPALPSLAPAAPLRGAPNAAPVDVRALAAGARAPRIDLVTPDHG